ncbi:MAG: ribonuclease III [Rhodospirillales bacterium]|nr:ribonuclease III [Rhodospirillales bacterium]
MTGRVQGLQDRLGHRFAKPELLRQALVHSSVANTPDRRSGTNERLEFLGDRVLGVVIADLLLRLFPNEDEGAIARRYAALVRREALARVAATISLAPDILLSPAEADTGGRDNPGILADCCEAIVAALYLDGGLEAARVFIEREWEPLLVEAIIPPQDAKSALQEWSQARGLGLPFYREVERSGPSHAPSFAIEVRLGDLGAVIGVGNSKRTAEQAAAQVLLDRAQGKT